MLKNLVLENGSAPGSGATINLAGSPAGRRTFASSYATGALLYYFLTDGTQNEWGVGTFTTGTPNTLSRTTVLGNSAGTTSRLNFTAAVQVYNDTPAERSLFADNALKTALPGALVVPGDASVLSLNSGGLGGMRNRVVNGAFLFNQRQYVNGTALGSGLYGYDRWKAGAGGATFSVTANYPFNTCTITAGTLTQIIEGPALIEGGSYVLSWAGTAQGRINGGAYGGSPRLIAGIAYGASVTIEFSTGTLTTVQFELGGVATPFEIRHHTQDLDMCLRYFERINYAAGEIIGIGSVFLQPTPPQAFGIIIPFMGYKRAVPTLSAAAVGFFTMGGIVCNGMAFSTASPQRMVVSATTATGSVGTNWATIDLTAGGSGAWFAASAEL